MKANRERSGVVAGIMLPLGLVCLFAFCALALALLGGQAYRSIQAGVDDNYGSTVAASYLRTKLAHSEGIVCLRTEEDVQLLVIASEEGGVSYETRIWFCDGLLMESFERADTGFATIGGIQIAQLANCVFSLDEDGLFTAELVSPQGVVTRTAHVISTGGVL